MINRHTIFVSLLLLSLYLPKSGWSAAYIFDATTTKMQVTSVAAIETTVVSICLWTYRLGNGETNLARLMDKLTSETTGCWHLFDRGATAAQYGMAADFTTNNADWRIDRPANGAWAHLCWSWNGTTKSPTAFVNGASVTVTVNTAPTGTYRGAGNAPLVVGNDPAQANTYNGHLAEVVYLNRLITATDAKAIMTCGPKAVGNGVVGYWPLGNFLGLNTTAIASLNLTVTAGTGSISVIGPPLPYEQGDVCE